jgi:protein-S-isoprenylcysteine O-methyltransferase Ste14
MEQREAAPQGDDGIDPAAGIRRVAAAWFALQGAGIAAWWVMLWLAPETRAWFTPPHWPSSTLLAFWLPDLALACGGSLAAAWLWMHRARAAGAVSWFVAGAMAYGTLYCVGGALAGGGAWLSVALMTPAALASAACAALAAAPPGRLYRPAPPAGAGRNVARTLLQCVVVWGVTLALLPVLLRIVESTFDLPRVQAPVLRPAGAVLFVAFSALNLWTGLTLATRGEGTPLPLESPRRLVVSGPYRRVRNPMAVAGLGQGLAIAAWFGSWLLLAYVIAGGLLWNFALRPGEERDLLRRFGDEYRAYQRAVLCWIPTIRAYRAPAEAAREPIAALAPSNPLP